MHVCSLPSQPPPPPHLPSPFHATPSSSSPSSIIAPYPSTAMADAANFRQRNRLSPDVTRILYVRNLPFKLSSDELYDIFGKYGPIRQVRLD